MHRRRFVATLAAGSVVATAGCVDEILESATSHEASPATVADDALEQAGYEHRETRDDVREEEVRGETVELTNYIGEYIRTLELPNGESVDAGAFAAISSPQVSIAGEEFNPIGEMDNREVTEMALEQYSEVSIGDSLETNDVETLGTSIEVETFEGVAAYEGELSEEFGDEIEVRIDVSRFEHGDDHLVVGGVYPEAVPAEGDRVTTMVEGVEHDG